DGVGYVLELVVALVAEETGALRLRAVVAGDRVFADEDVEQSITVVIQNGGAAAAEVLRAGAAVLRNVGEVALTVVAEKNAADMLILWIGHVAEVQVEVTAVVKIGEQHAGAARRDGDGGLGVPLELALPVTE